MLFVVGKAFGILPTDERLKKLSTFQMLWLYMNVKKDEHVIRKTIEHYSRLLCTFINPEIAKKIFNDEEEKTVNTNFEDQIKEMDPKFDSNKLDSLLRQIDG